VYSTVFAAPFKKTTLITMATEMQIQVQLDSNGRTTWAREGQSVDLESRKIDGASNQQNIDYSTKSVTTCLASKHDDWLDDLLFDCEVSVSGKTRETSCLYHSHLFFRLRIVD
jgi:hypothetical protein